MQSRVLLLLAIVAATCAAPPDNHNPVELLPVQPEPWFKFPFLDNIFSQVWSLIPNFRVMPQDLSDDKQFLVTVHFDDIKKEDINVKVKNGAVMIKGSSSTPNGESYFNYFYSLPPNISGSDVKATLSKDGYLVVSAPQSEKAVTNNEDRVVPIEETGLTYDVKKQADEDRKEPTTPRVPITTGADIELTTDKDNSIPHGNLEKL